MATITVSVLYFDGCPNHPPAVEAVRRVADRLGIDVRIEQIDVPGPDRVHDLRFLGSPTIQVNGEDVEPTARTRTDFAFGCRTYPDGSGVPSDAMIVAALREAMAGSDVGRGDSIPAGAPASHDGAGRVAASGGAIVSASASIVAAMASSACCWGPLALIGLGISAGGMAGFFERWRPILAPVAIGMVTLSFILAYRRPRGCSGSGACCERPTRIQRVSRVMSWISAVLVLAFVLFPNYATGLMRRVSASRAPVTPISAGGDATGENGVGSSVSGAMVFDVKGMTCPACAAGLEGHLRSLPGLGDAQVDYESKTILVPNPGGNVAGQVAAAAEQRGFSASPRRSDPPDQGHPDG